MTSSVIGAVDTACPKINFTSDRHKKAKDGSNLRKSLLAAAITTGLLAACGDNDNNNNDNGGTRPPVAVNQLNTLQGSTKDIVVELHEGTNMAVAPSPDGKRIAFTAQGALWVMSIAGGTATRITNWLMEPTAPVWSPDGKSIAFQNYTQEGNYHIWTIDQDGTNEKEITTGFFDDREPVWAPDGTKLIFSSDRSGDQQYKIWSVSLTGGTYMQLTKGNGAESNPIVSPDGKQLAFVDTAKVYKAPLSDSGAGMSVLVGPGTAPAWTPNSAGLVYQSTTGSLNISGKDIKEKEDLFPFPVRYLPDGKFIYAADGKIRMRDPNGTNPKDIPFSASLTVRRPAITKVRDRGFSNFSQRAAVGISAPAISPDGKSVAFVALNDVWVMTVGQDPVRLTNDTDRDGNPQWTADGTAVYFSSEKGNAGALAIDKITVATKARTRLASIVGKSMVTPKLSPTGDRIAYTTLSGQLEVWNIESKTAQVIIPSVSTQVGTPSWTPDGSKIMVVDNERFNNRFREGYNKLRVIDLATKTARFFPVAEVPRQISERDEGAAVLSPDGSKVAFIMDSVLNVIPVGADGAPTGPAVTITKEAADMPSWAGDSQTIMYKSADKLRTVNASGGASHDVPLNVTWTQAVPQGTTLVRAGKLWDGVSPTMQTDVDILITGNRITSINPHVAGSEATATRFVDASALTIMPGLWDPHVHALTLYQGGQYGQIAALMLSYGITSTQSVAGPIHQSIEIREALEAGNLLGPRLFVSPPLWEGNRLYYNFARTLRTPEVVDIEIAKAKTMGVDYMKSYVRSPIPTMVKIAQAGLDQGVPTGTHMLAPGAAAGIGGTTHLSATQRMGYGWSKSVGGFTYQDAADLHAKGDFRLVDTLFSAQALAGDDPSIIAGERFSVLVPPNFVNGLKNMAPPTATQLATVKKDAQQSAKVMAAGALVAHGTDSPLVVPGISLHLNLRAAGMAMTNYQALQSITLNAAKMSFVDKDLGSVEVGKLADLVAVRGNPLDDLKNAANTELVIKNGFTYSIPQILAPFKAPLVLAAHRKAIIAYNKMCKQDPEYCHSSMMHAD